MIQPTIIPTAMPHGYNASVAMLGGCKLFSYRYHPNQGQWRTQMAIQESSDIWATDILLKLPDFYAEMSHEDGRFFWFNGKLHMSLTVAVFPGVENTSPPCITIYGELRRGENFWHLDSVVTPKYGNNDWSGQNKNNL